MIIHRHILSHPKWEALNDSVDFKEENHSEKWKMDSKDEYIISFISLCDVKCVSS